MSQMLNTGYLLFLGNTTDLLDAKTARGILEWRPERCTGQWRLDRDTIDIGLHDLTPEQAVVAGAKTMVIGIAPVGGAIESHWIAPICRAIRAGLDIASGLHQRLAEIPQIAAAAKASGRSLHDVRHSDSSRMVATGVPRTGNRVLTVGTDCAIGKKFTALAVHKEMERRGIESYFRATGQTGIMIAGEGIAIDAVIADFAAGAAEALSPATAPDAWSIVEGQGSLFHPAYAGVSLALLHGAQPNWIILCHEPGRTTIDGFPDFPLPSVEEAIARNLEAARLTSPNIACAGISLDTSRLDTAAGRAAVATLAQRTGLPVVDPLVEGPGALVDAMLNPGAVRDVPYGR